MSFDYDTAFGRNVGMVTREDMGRLRSFRIGIAGQGGVGGHYLIALTRMGFEKFTIMDGDTFDTSNLNRQVGATTETMGRPKVEVMREMALAINPRVDVRTIRKMFSKETSGPFFEGIDFAINSIDYFSAAVYEALHDGARNRGLYSITGSPFGFSTSVTMFGPESPSFVECFGIRPEDDDVTRLGKFWNAVTPARLPHAYLPNEWLTATRPMNTNLIPAVNVCVYLATAMVCTEVLVTLLKKRPPTLAPNVIQIDLLTRALAVTPVHTQYAIHPARDR
ncbi:ThiF family adenylyltransferase [Pendulispora albinea]|uniref:ThiF family adenylyltransferase n=1 Tax=Pendulispora albinea TaxID=2741071 RepID=A0ABZ2LSX6_9BACT